MSMSEDAETRVKKYITVVENAIAGLIVHENPVDTGKREVDTVLDLAERYLADAKYYCAKGEASVALASICYAEGLLDASRLLKFISIPGWSGRINRA